MTKEQLETPEGFDSKKNIIIENLTDSIRPNLKRAKLAQIFVWIVMVFDIISLISSYLQYNLLQALDNNEEVSNQILESNDTREQVIGILYFIIFIISSIVYIQWFRRAYYNLNIRTQCNHSEGWAAGSWFVPIISLFRPYQIMKEMFNKTSYLINSKTSNTEESDNSIIGLWWALWIISNYIGQYVLKNAFKDDTIQSLLNSTIGDLAMSIIGIPLAICAVMIIKSYSLKEEKLSELEKIEN